MKLIENKFIEIVAEQGFELFNGEVSTNRISAPLGTDISIWVERKATQFYAKIESDNEAQQLYDVLIEQGKLLFEVYRIKLMQVSYEDVVRGVVSEQFKGLVTMLEQVKERIKVHLKTSLDNNDIEALQAFSYQTEEAQQLDDAINAFQK